MHLKSFSEFLQLCFPHCFFFWPSIAPSLELIAVAVATNAYAVYFTGSVELLPPLLSLGDGCVDNDSGKSEASDIRLRNLS
mmetsp:Transcript_24468/g.36647  ORF Transcript_24468/g.36647 Transcript_24468/m.36647 type:complete len:81 (-) Transcript_24468:545-787(-)